MDSEVKINTTPNEIYVKRYETFKRLRRIQKMLSKTKIIIHLKEK